MRCLRCDTDNAPTEIYCARCGAILAPETGELRTVTVLFADIRGFTALSERRTAEEIATRVINECFTLLAEQIEAYGGVVDKFIGDAVMALFGAPRAHENDPERAIMAAVGMQDVLAQFSARVEKLIGGKLEMRVGINTGQAVAGWFGSARNRAYTVIGDTVNLASRIEHAGRPGKIWVNEATYRQTEHAFDFEAIGPLTLKGKSKPALVYEIVGPKSVRERWRGVRGLRALLVDRRDELDSLSQTLAQAIKGHGRRVSLIGEAGIGKSRLWVEFEEQARRTSQLAEAFVLKGRSLPYGQLNTYGTVREILNSFLSDGHGEASPETLQARAGDDDAPLLGQLLGLDMPLGQRETPSPEELAREIHQAVIRLFRRAAQAQPLLLIFEDAHWIDPSSLTLLRELLPSLSDLRALVCCLYRPDFTGLDEMPGAPEAQVRITLPPLSESESRELIEHLLTVENLPASLKQTIIQKAAGNPFYVEEMLKSLIEGGRIAQRDGRWAVTGDWAIVSVPDTVQGIVMTRIDGLPDSIKRTLQQAAVIGPVFGAGLLAEIASAPVAEHLARLEELDFIVGSGGEYRFRNLLGQEVAYHSLLLTQRRALHCAIAAALERHYAGRLESQYALLADHYEHGGLWPKALEYRKKAGARAQRLYDNAVAVAHLSRALDIIARWEEGPQSLLEDAEAYPQAPSGFFDAQRAEVWTARGDVLALTGQYDQATADFQTALQHEGREEPRAELYWRIGSIHEKLGHYGAALAALQTGIALVESDPQSSALLKLLSTLGWVFIRQGQPEQARAVSVRSLAMSKAHHVREAALALKSLGYASFIQGDLNQAATHWQRSLSLVEQAGDQRELARVNNNLGMIAARRGYPDDASAHFQRALEVLERVGDAEAVATIYNNLGGAYAMAGRSGHARDYYLKSLQAHLALGHALEAAGCQMNLGELARKTGDLHAAIDCLTRSRDAMETLGAVEDLPEVYRQLAATHLAASDLLAAYQHGERALEYARTAGNRLEEGIVHRVLGQIAGEQSQPDHAAEHLAQSRAILEELGSEHELALTLVEEAGLLEGEMQREKLQLALEIFRRLGASAEAEGVKRLLDAYAHA